MRIRCATEADIPRMIGLLRQVGDVHHEARPDLFREDAQKYDEAALETLLCDPERPILSVDEGGVMVGYAFCILQRTRGNPVLADRTVLYLDDLCVDEALRGSGAARALMDGVVALAKEMGCQAVTLNVWCGNDRAMRFYEKCGMKPQKIGMEMIL